ncbi:hypothetical protein [Amycolatopsis sp. YIM 10]|uniref:hypothetical protein n=1 Tax=Amycolatopsis sp. YIM 10 TaxID=2653857 RepID=UPI00129015D9|nr:hypothetical protein [Amycolatopsis sp. YIM 10]QFU93170.1 hypothetical protein YIM_40155 [Amycolatopsis sp. YIM 10]
MPLEELSHRERAILRAVGRGRAETTCSSEPDLFVDGLACCHQNTVRELAHRGLFTAAAAGARGCRVPAKLTAAGYRAIGFRVISRAAEPGPGSAAA